MNFYPQFRSIDLITVTVSTFSGNIQLFWPLCHCLKPVSLYGGGLELFCVIPPKFAERAVECTGAFESNNFQTLLHFVAKLI